MRDFVFDYIKKKYKILPDYPWMKYDDNAVFRHGDNRKWFALVMGVKREKLGLSGEGCVDVMNLKVDDYAGLSYEQAALDFRAFGRDGCGRENF